MLQTLRKIVDGLTWAALVVSAIGLVGMTVAVTWQVFGRYVLNSTPTWSEPLSIQLMAWFILLGAAVGVREGTHLGFDVLKFAAGPVIGRLMESVSLIAVCFFGLAMIRYGWQLVVGTWTATLPILGWPGGVDFLPIVVGGALISLFALDRLLSLYAPVSEAARS